MSEKVSVYQVITDRIVKMLDEGTVPWRKGWTGGVNGNLPRNIRGTAYRGINTWLLSALGYDSPYFLTYKQAQALGGKVTPGQKGMSVVLWQPFEKVMFDEKKGMDVKKRLMTLRYYTVFNVQQTEGCKFPKKVQASIDAIGKPVEGPAFDPIEAAEDIVNGWLEGPVVAHDGNGRAYYVPSEDIIHLPKRESFHGAGEYYSTRFHEMSHSTGHTSRLARDQKNYFGDHGYGVEELTAEFSAAFLNALAGLDPLVIENNAAYIQSWKAAIKADPKLVITAAGKAQKSADLIIGAVVAKEDIESEQEQEAA